MVVFELLAAFTHKRCNFFTVAIYIIVYIGAWGRDF